MRYWLCVLVLTFTISSSVDASGLEPNVCVTQATTVEMIQCADWHYKQADRWLNQVYKNQSKYKDAPAKKLLRDAQRAWIKFWDAECQPQRNAGRGGTIVPLFEIGCLTSMTENRARYLSTPQSFEDHISVQMLEKPGSSIIGDFKCDGQIRDAHIGLVAISPSHATFVRARLEIGNESLEWQIGGDRQDAFCSFDLTLSAISHPEHPMCPALKIDDGMYDVFFLGWDA